MAREIDSMPTYKVSWIHREQYWATVDADSPEEAVAKAKMGEHNNDCDSDTGKDDMRSFKCEGEVYPQRRVNRLAD